MFRPYERTKREPQSSDSSSRISSLITTKQATAAPKPETTSKPEPEEKSQPVSTTGKAKRVPRKKDRPTPTREQAEAERMERLHPTLTPREQRKRDREARMQNRIDAMDRMENSPERRLARDWVDTRWTISEFMLPLMLVIMAAVMVTMPWPILSTYIGLLLWVLLLFTIVNFFIMWRSYRAELARRMPAFVVRGKGLRLYMFNRMIMIRRFRRPPAEIKRGEPVR